MTIATEATYENGILKLKGPLDLVEGTQVRLTVTPVCKDHDPLDPVIGIGEGPTDGADNHDKYIRGKTPVIFDGTHESSNPEVGIWQRIELEGELCPAAARALLKVHVAHTDVERMHALSAKARAGTLSPREEAEMDAYERLGCLLDILHSKARRALKNQRTGF